MSAKRIYFVDKEHPEFASSLMYPNFYLRVTFLKEKYGDRIELFETREEAINFFNSR